MSTDRELLELAASAAGIEHDGYFACIPVDVRHPRDGDSGLRLKTYEPWNPLTDDGDALRLAVSLGITIEPILEKNEIWAYKPPHERMGERKRSDERDIMSATRRAITRAAAEIGKAMP